MQGAYKLFISAVLVLWPQFACAITLTNRDATDQKLIIIEGDKQKERLVKPGERVELCPKSCVIRLPDGEDYEFDGEETVSLQEGLLYLDNPDELTKTPR
jgi:hypothetical protein